MRRRGGPAHQPASPYQEATNGRKDESNDEEDRKNSLGCQDRLPGLQSLLFESSIWVPKDMLREKPISNVARF